MYQRFCSFWFLAIACTLSISGCNLIQPRFQEESHGRLLIWHPFPQRDLHIRNINPKDR
ncbi:MAG: hypothetical protein AB4368_32745 [Xenococcaceae cyanobacterium]